MATPGGDDIDHILAVWRQGDCVVGDCWFAFRADPAVPLTPAATEACDPETGMVDEPVPGLVVVSQTCDLLRSCATRPLVEVAVLAKLDDARWHAACQGRTPRFAPVPGLAARHLAADLDRIMTVEKSVVAARQRVPGCVSDGERQSFSQCLARKRGRFAYIESDHFDLEHLSTRRR